MKLSLFCTSPKEDVLLRFPATRMWQPVYSLIEQVNKDSAAQGHNPDVFGGLICPTGRSFQRALLHELKDRKRLAQEFVNPYLDDAAEKLDQQIAQLPPQLQILRRYILAVEPALKMDGAPEFLARMKRLEIDADSQMLGLLFRKEIQNFICLSEKLNIKQAWLSVMLGLGYLSTLFATNCAFLSSQNFGLMGLYVAAGAVRLSLVRSKMQRIISEWLDQNLENIPEWSVRSLVQILKTVSPNNLACKAAEKWMIGIMGRGDVRCLD